MFWHLRMILAYQKTLGKLTKVLGFEKTPPPPLWEKFPKNPVFFCWERPLTILRWRPSRSKGQNHPASFYAITQGAIHYAQYSLRVKVNCLHSSSLQKSYHKQIYMTSFWSPYSHLSIKMMWMQFLSLQINTWIFSLSLFFQSFFIPKNLFKAPQSTCTGHQNTVQACGRPHRGMLNGRQISISCVFLNHSRLILSGIFRNPWELWRNPVRETFCDLLWFFRSSHHFPVQNKITRGSKKAPSKFDSSLYVQANGLRQFGLSNNHHKGRGKPSWRHINKVECKMVRHNVYQPN